MSQQDLLAALPAQHRKHLDPASPPPVRMMAARGMAPLPPYEMVLVLCGLSLDADEKLASGARGALEKLPEGIVQAAIERGLPPAALEALLPFLGARDTLLEKVVLSRHTPDALVARIAKEASAALVEIIVQDQERALRSEAVVRAVKTNGNLLKSSSDRLFDFLLRSGVVYDDMPEYAEAMARLSPTERQEAADNIQLPPEVAGLLDHTGDERVDPEAVAKALENAPEASDRVPMLKLVNSLNVAQKIALAIKGNKEARTILVRDHNKLVAAAAIRSPRITDQEVMMAASSRSVADEVIRIVANSKDMTRPYGVKMALVNNPKTPLQTSMRFLSLLRDADLRNVAKSKNITSALANQAKRMVLKKQKGR